MKFYGQVVDGISVDEKLLPYFKGLKRGFFIEAGANDGVYLSSCKVFEDIGWRGINVEPSAESFKRLVKNRPNSINVRAALSNRAGSIPFSYCDNRLGVFSTTGNKRLPRGKRLTKTYLVPCVTYSYLIRLYRVTSVDLFVLDVEGDELQVIAGMFSIDVLPRIICVEHNHSGLKNLVAALSKKYVLDNSDSLNAIFKIK